jgi:hypothetical protein
MTEKKKMGRPIGSTKKVALAPDTQVPSAKYADLIQQSQQEKDQQELSLQADQAKLDLQQDIVATKRSLAEAEIRLLRTKSSIPFNSQAVVNAQIGVEGLKEGLARLNALDAELF